MERDLLKNNLSSLIAESQQESLTESAQDENDEETDQVATLAKSASHPSSVALPRLLSFRTLITRLQQTTIQQGLLTNLRLDILRASSSTRNRVEILSNLLHSTTPPPQLILIFHALDRIAFLYPLGIDGTCHRSLAHKLYRQFEDSFEQTESAGSIRLRTRCRILWTLFRCAGEGIDGARFSGRENWGIDLRRSRSWHVAQSSLMVRKLTSEFVASRKDEINRRTVG